MSRYRRWFACVVVAVAYGVWPASAGATTIETFTFTQSGWNIHVLGLVVPDNGVLQGTFTGILDEQGRIPLANITAFSASYKGSVEYQLPFTLQFFAFDATPFDTVPSGPSSQLDFIAMDVVPNTHFNGATVCVGAAATLSPTCNLGNNDPSTKGIFLLAFAGDFFSLDVPILTLQSRVDISDTDPAAATVPEPGSLMLFGTGLTTLTIATRRRRSLTNTVGISN